MLTCRADMNEVCLKATYYSRISILTFQHFVRKVPKHYRLLYLIHWHLRQVERSQACSLTASDFFLSLVINFFSCNIIISKMKIWKMFPWEQFHGCVSLSDCKRNITWILLVTYFLRKKFYQTKTFYKKGRFSIS